MKKYKFLIAFLFVSLNLISQWEVKYVDEANFETLNKIEFYNDSLGFSMGTMGLILKSENLGENWTKIPSDIEGDIIDFAFISEQKLLCLSSFIDGQDKRSIISKSIDNGTTWDNVFTSQDCLFSIQSTQNAIFVSGYNLIYKSIDEGNTWNSVYDLRSDDFIFGEIQKTVMINDEIGYAAGGAWTADFSNFLGVLIKTVDGGNSWKKIKEFDSTWFYEMHFWDTETGYISNNYKTLKTEDGGIKWDTLENLYGAVDFATPSPNKIITVNRPEAYNSAANLTVFAINESHDAGDTWIGNYMNGAHLESVYFNSDSVGFVAGDYSLIMKTETCGGEIVGNYPWQLFISSTIDLNHSLLEFHPNPVDDKIMLNIENPKKWQFRIISNLGGTVNTGKLDSNEINLNSIPKGIYYLILENGRKRKIGKLIKK